MRFTDFLFKLEEGTLEEVVSKWQKKRKQTSGHRAKKVMNKKLSSKQAKSSKELKRLSGISAKREVKNFFAKQMFKKKFTDLDPNQKDKINEKMKTNLAMQKVVKLTNEKFQERIKKQKEKLSKEKETEKKETEKTKKASEKKDVARKADIAKREKKQFDKKIGAE